VTKDDLLRGLLAQSAADGRYYGVVVGVVTNNRDPDHMHRVKLRFPWLNQEDESNWARVASPMAGDGRGAYFLPEVDDEVLVAFEHGSVEFPYVIGSLWNGRDKPHENNDDGQNNHRCLKSRSGHVIRLCDRAGQETIELIDKTGNNKMVFKSTDNSITIEAQGNIELKSQTGKLTISAVGIELKSMAGVDITANANVNVKGVMINLN
jgi:uncharacterized protein involved in type VI secretion and phage assembly